MTQPETSKGAAPPRRPVRGRATAISPAALVRTGALHPDRSLPALVEPRVAGVDLAAWAGHNRETVGGLLAAHGGALFRGFDVSSFEEFERLARAVSGELLEYRERSSPRSKVSGSVYTSTEYPADQSIFLHCENSYQRTWPMKLFFYCATPPAEGGETPIADTRRVLARIGHVTRDLFESKGVLYVRNFNTGFGLTWQTAFQTESREAVEAYCRAGGIDVEWREGDRLTTRQVRPAIRRHPATGEAVWFNHGAFFNALTLEESVRTALVEALGEDGLPSQTYFGDGTPIDPEVMAELHAAYRDETVAFAWERGDVLLLDNMLAAHGRRPYSGPRLIAVAMAEPYGGEPR